MRGLKLPIQPRPASTWGKTLANLLSKRGWDDMRAEVYRDADYKCQVCESDDHQFHAHEVWKFDDKKLIMRLQMVVCVCRLCHDVIHFGRSSQVYPKDYQGKLIQHWCKINGKTRADFTRYRQEIYALNRKRANKYYVVKVGRRILA